MELNQGGAPPRIGIAIALHRLCRTGIGVRNSYNAALM